MFLMTYRLTLESLVGPKKAVESLQCRLCSHSMLSFQTCSCVSITRKKPGKFSLFSECYCSQDALTWVVQINKAKSSYLVTTLVDIKTSNSRWAQMMLVAWEHPWIPIRRISHYIKVLLVFIYSFHLARKLRTILCQILEVYLALFSK